MKNAAQARHSRFCFASSLLTVALLCGGSQFSLAAPPADASVLKGGNARVIFVGDSITGLSRNYATGFAHQIQWALKSTYPKCTPDLVALGGSGQGIVSWRGVEQRSRKETCFLDVRGIDVKAALDRPADLVVIMLGMNDVLAPYVADDPVELDRWSDGYRSLIDAIRQRVKPGVVALATITMCTEDPASPRNRLMDQLNRRVAMLAEQLGCRVLRTGESVEDVLRQGRRLRPDFHVTYDFVHPNEAGHLGIAIAMLKGLGEPAAAQRLADERLARVLQAAAGPGPSLSYEWTPLAGPLDSQTQQFRVRYWYGEAATPPSGPVRVSLAGQGWKVQPDHCDTAEGEFLIAGETDRRMNLLTLECNHAGRSGTREVRIPAPWLVAAGTVQPMWSGMKFNPAKALTPVDAAILRGDDFRAVKLDPAKGTSLTWRRLFPTIDYTGLDSPGSVDFVAVTPGRNFETGYGARWIYSPRERPVGVALGVQAFAGALHLTVFLNGRELYAGHITSEPRKKKEIDARVRQGWNTLVFKANHCAWQWQCSVDLTPVGKDTLDDLRYRTSPQPK